MFLWKEWCWSWNSSTLATSCEELTHWKRLWCWEGLRAGGKGDDRGWDGWMVSLTRWTWVWVNSRSWWWTGRPGVLWFMGSQRVGHDWATELNWTEMKVKTNLLTVSLGKAWERGERQLLASLLLFLPTAVSWIVYLTQKTRPSSKPPVYEWDLILKYGLCRCNYIKDLKMRPSWNWGGP